MKLCLHEINVYPVYFERTRSINALSNNYRFQKKQKFKSSTRKYISKNQIIQSNHSNASHRFLPPTASDFIHFISN